MPEATPDDPRSFVSFLRLTLILARSGVIVGFFREGERHGPDERRRSFREWCRPLAIDGPVYACGDLHGRDDLMLEFLAWVDADAGHGPATVVFLGDFVDRGFGGRRVVERLMCGPSRKDHRWVPLKGNHDALFASAWRNPGGRDAVAWVANGGVATLASYGVAPGEPFRDRVPEAHVEFLEKLPLAADDGERLYVHAGSVPECPWRSRARST